MSNARQALARRLADAATQEALLEQLALGGRLVIPVQHFCPSDRAYYLSIPERKADNPVLEVFKAWLIEEMNTYNATAEQARLLRAKPKARTAVA